MNTITKSLALLGTLAPLTLLAVTGGDTKTIGSEAKTTVGADTLAMVAKGKGVSVSRSQLDDEIVRTKAVMAAQNQAVPPEATPVLEQQLLDKLISEQLILSKATPADFAKGKDDFDKTLQKIKSDKKISDVEFNTRLNQQMQLLNLTRSEWEKQNAERATIPLVLERELKVQITDQDVKKFYDENPARFEQPETVRAAHILLMTSDPISHAELSDEKKAEKKKQIEALLKRARAGEDFAKLAKENSEDPGSKELGGEYTFPRGQMVAEFESTAFSQNTNQISDVITTQFGYHIIKTYAKMPARKLALTDKVPGSETTFTSAVKDSLTQQSLAQKAPDYLTKLRKEAGVEILDEKLKIAAAAREKELSNLKNTNVDAPAGFKAAPQGK